MKTWTREKFEQLVREHRTQEAAAKAAGVSRSTISRLASRYGIRWEKSMPTTFGNAAWQELGR